MCTCVVLSIYILVHASIPDSQCLAIQGCETCENTTSCLYDK